MLAARISFRPVLVRTNDCVGCRLNLPCAWPRSRPFSSSSSNKGVPGVRWRVFARIVRYIRLPVLLGSLWGVGYQQGIISCARNPDEVKQSLLMSVLADWGCTDPELAHAVTDDLVVARRVAQLGRKMKQAADKLTRKNQQVTWKENRSARRVARIGRKIKKAAKELARTNQRAAIKEVMEKLPQDVTEQQFMQVLQLDEAFIMWTAAIENLEGRWTYMHLDVEPPNAFVTEFVPRHIFITSGMLSIIANDDELALVLGHELSHMILGHNVEGNILDGILRAVEVLLLSIDPTTGLLSLGVIGFLATLRKALTARYSREQEKEADKMGIQLAAMACFDTFKAADVFRRINEQSIAVPDQHNLSVFADSHPPSRERYENMVKMSETQNAATYADTTCASIASRLKSAIKSNKNSRM